MPSADDIRALALELPAAEEAPHFDATSFRVKGKIFATMGEEAGRVTLKLDREDQHNLIEAHPKAIQPVEGYWGRSGWTTVSFDGIDDDLMATLLRMAWARVAPKRLLG